ncbi:MAG TPA: double-strand break repair protein AddB [Rhodospirillaceae bacterium]|nr:double-strand break repair protein AddB [Rhodospirillaceae bacterium]
MADSDLSIFTIAADHSFVDSLAARLLAETDDDPLRLADTTLLLPTRRACRALSEAFLRLRDGEPLVLPAMRALGDTDEEGLALEEAPGLDLAELPPAMPDSRRVMALAERIIKYRADLLDTPEYVSLPEQSLLLAAELARFLDQVQTERLSFAGLDALVPDELAIHWQETLAFLREFTEYWPDEVEEMGFLEPVMRRNRLLEAKVRQWKQQPPAGDIVAAGSTGSIPATADLLKVIAGLPRGRVVLPGLDIHSDDENWKAIEDDPTHPQFVMAQLLRRFGVSRSDVRRWETRDTVQKPVNKASPRARLILEAMRPARTTTAWQSLKGFETASLEGLSLLECANETEEAGVIALILRSGLETEGKTGALVTGDRRLARRVAAALKRWNIEIDDSAGVPLSETPPAVFMRLVAEMIAEGFGPVALLGFGKHPLAAAGYEPARFRSLMRALDKNLLRGPRPAPGIAGLRAVLAGRDGKALSKSAKADFVELFDRLEHRTTAMLALGDGEVSLSALVDAHIEVCEALAESAGDPGAERLWAGENGEALALFFADLRDSADAFSDLAPAHYPAMLEVLLGRSVVRPRFGKHPRLNIWGPLEARMQRADCLIVGGLNESNWPRDPAPDPWLSRPMRKSFGLPAPEQRIGLSAHDFTQALAGPEVILTRARKADGAPTVPTRWLSRLQSVLHAAGHADGLAVPHRWIEWQRALVRPGSPEPTLPPAPVPPLSARPKQLSVTRIETWMRDPYSIYARHILDLRKLDPLAADPGSAERGIIIHAALDRFMRLHPEKLPSDALSALLAIGEGIFGEELARPAVRAFWWPRFRRIAEWFIDLEGRRRDGIQGSVTESKGSIVLDTKAGPFELTALADRIDRLNDGALEVIDYKTGAVPSEKEVRLGFAPQLSLEAVIAERSGFAGLDGASVQALSYWRLTGGDPAGEVKSISKDMEALAAEALKGLQELVDRFSDPGTAYAAIPAPAHRPRYNDYAHLERILEWSGGAGD